jgi:hypothetical protein
MKIQRCLASLLAVCSAIQGANAWGNMGHETIAFIAQNFVTAKTKTFCQNILGDTSTSYLATAATWADSFRYTSAGSYSRPYHFIDSNDDPLNGNCGSDYTRDCGSGGCVVSAINNYVCSLPIPSWGMILTSMKDNHSPLRIRSGFSEVRRPRKHL